MNPPVVGPEEYASRMTELDLREAEINAEHAHLDDLYAALGIRR